MDPTKDLIKIRNSFPKDGASPDVAPLMPFQLVQPIVDLKLKLETVFDRDSAGNLFYPIAKYVDTNLYAVIQHKKSKMENIPPATFRKARAETNPFDALSFGHQFGTRASMKLANIDAVFKLTGPNVSYFQPIDFKADVDRRLEGEDAVVYAGVAEGPGDFIKYLQYRWPNAIGFGITLRDASSKSLEWSKELIFCSKNRGGFTPLWGAPRYGGDETGNLYTNAESFAAEVLSKTRGCRLVTGDGGMAKNTEEDYAREELINSRLILAQVYAALLVLRSDIKDPISGNVKGGDYVQKVFDMVTEFNAQLMFILANCFKEIHLFKPIASRPANSERYIVCRELRANIEPFKEILKAAYHKYDEVLAASDAKKGERRQVYVTNIFDVGALAGSSQEAWQKFGQWLAKINTIQMQSQEKTIDKILTYARSGKDEVAKPGNKLDEDKYDLKKALILWNLRDIENI